MKILFLAMILFPFSSSIFAANSLFGECSKFKGDYFSIDLGNDDGHAVVPLNEKVHDFLSASNRKRICVKGNKRIVGTVNYLFAYESRLE